MLIAFTPTSAPLPSGIRVFHFTASDEARAANIKPIGVDGVDGQLDPAEPGSSPGRACRRPD